MWVDQFEGNIDVQMNRTVLDLFLWIIHSHFASCFLVSHLD